MKNNSTADKHKNKRITIIIISYALLLVALVIGKILIGVFSPVGMRDFFNVLLIITLLLFGLSIIAFAIYSNLRDRNKEKGQSHDNKEKRYSSTHKAKVIIGCFAIHTFIAQLLIIFLKIFDMMKYFDYIVTPYVFLGWIIVFPLSWKILIKKID